MKVNLTEVLQKLMAIHNVTVTEYKTPFENENINWGLRKTFYPDFDGKELVNTFAAVFEKNTLYIVQDIFDVYYAAFITDISSKSVIVIGPYRLAGEVFKETEYVQKGFFEEQLKTIKEYLLNIPYIHEDIITQQITAVLSVAVTDKNLKTQYVKENVHRDKVNSQFYFVQSEINSEKNMNMVEQRYNAENEMLEAVSLGSVTKARNTMRKLMKENFFGRYTISATQQKKSLIIFNTLLRKAVEKANVHPYYIDEISYRFFQKIDLVSNQVEQIKLIDEMIVGYCEYTKRYSAEPYSAVIREAINYVHTNINNKISLTEIAQHLQISPGYLSKQFHTETGKTIVEYINCTRMLIAANKLKKTSATIAKISESVGIHDTNYFSRIFRKYMGCSPTEYREKMINRC